MPATPPAAPPVIGSQNLSTLQGQRSLNAVASQRKVPQFIIEEDVSADVAPLFLLSEKMGVKKVVQQAVYFHSERDFNPTTVNIDPVSQPGGVAPGVVTINLVAGHGSRITPGTVLLSFETFEEARVLSIGLGAGPNGTDQITVTRAFANTLPGTFLPNDELTIEGFADVEGSRAPAGISVEPAIKNNCVQTYRYPIELTGRELSSDVFGTPEMEAVRKGAQRAVMTQIEKTWLFSQGSNLSDPYKTAGIPSWVQTNVSNLAGDRLVESTLYDYFLRPLFRKNYGVESNIMVFAGENFVRGLAFIGLGNIRYRPEDDALGIDVMRYKSPFGELKIVRHGLMTPVGSSVAATSNGPQGYAYGLNMDKIGKVTFKDRDMQYLQNRQEPSVDGKKMEYLCDCGFWLGVELRHAIMRGCGG